jgi:hypothetical protein
MKIFDLDILERDPNQDDLYDLSQVTYKKISGYPIYVHIVEKHEEMRIDLISLKCYSSTDYIDFLLNFNDIDNPLNIKEGDIINYIDANYVDFYRVIPDKPKVLKKRLLNLNKQTRKDSNRQMYVEENFSLPPTLLDVPVESVQIKDNTILIGVNENTTT